MVKGARKRAQVETYVRHEAVLRRTANRYSLCGDDADDALQRALEVLLTKAPSEDPRELIRWMQTVVKHEALAVRRERERILSGPAATARPGREDWVALIPADAAGPAERVERREAIARSREALRALKPQELRALSLLAEGYSYLEIEEITGFSQTKINRCLAEGRERFRQVLSRSEDGGRCEEMGPLLSAFCDGEAGEADAATVREHLRVCPSCRATMRAYRAAPGAAAALAPALPFGRSLFDRAHDALIGLAARFGGGGPAADSALSPLAAGGTRGAGMAALAKLAALCVGTAGGAACVATGVVPTPLDLGQGKAKAPAMERRIDPVVVAEWSEDNGVEYEPAQQQPPEHPPGRDDVESASTGADAELEGNPTAAASTGAVEYAPPPEPEPTPEPAPISGSSGEGSAAAAGSPAGEFGP